MRINIDISSDYLPAGLPRSGKLPVLNLLTGQKSGFFARSLGDSLHRFTSNFAEPTATLVRLAVRNFTSIAIGGWECSPQNIKNVHFLVESPHRGDSLDRFINFFRGFYASIYPTSLFQTWRDSLHRLLSYCWETVRQSIRPIFFCAPCRKNYVLDRKMDNAVYVFYLFMHDELYHHANFGVDRTTHTGCRCGNMVFLCFFCNSVTLRGRCAVRSMVTYFEQALCRGL